MAGDPEPGSDLRVVMRGVERMELQHEHNVRALQLAIKASGLSARRFATDILMRDERTIRRWLAGQSPIPAAVQRWLEQTKH